MDVMRHSPSKSHSGSFTALLASVVIFAVTLPSFADDSSSSRGDRWNAKQGARERHGRERGAETSVPTAQKPSTEQSGTLDHLFHSKEEPGRIQRRSNRR